MQTFRSDFTVLFRTYNMHTPNKSVLLETNCDRYTDSGMDSPITPLPGLARYIAWHNGKKARGRPPN